MISVQDLKKCYGYEIAAIILCCRVFFKTASATELNAFISENAINWDIFIQLAKVHRVRPVTYQVIVRMDIPAETRALIQKQHAAIIIKNWKHAVETERLILLLRANGISVVTYKGVAFSQQFFGDLTSRESSDIDLVIRQDCLGQAIAILKEDGYLPELEDIRQYLGDRYFEQYKDYCLNKFKNGKREFHIEMHWAVAEKCIGITPRVNDLLFDWNSTVTFKNASLAGLNDHSHFSAILIHHSIKEPFKQLKNIVDLSQAIRHPGIEEKEAIIVKSFKSFRLQKVLGVSNSITEQLMGVSLKNVPTPQHTEQTAQYFLTQICTLRQHSTHPIWSMILGRKNTGLLHDSFLQRLNFYLICVKFRFVPGQADFRLIQLPGYLYFLYYILKPLRSVLRPLDPLKEKRKLLRT